MTQLRIYGPESSQSSFIQFGAVLNDVEYQFELQWNNRHSFWILGIVDARRQPDDQRNPHRRLPRSCRPWILEAR